MSDTFFVFMILMAVIAVVLRADFLLAVVYLLLGAMIISRLWSRRALQQVKVERTLVSHAFPGDLIKVRLRVRNQGWLPVLWLELSEALPSELMMQEPFRRVVSLSPHQEAVFEYPMLARKRGYYTIGPLTLITGDLFGVANETFATHAASAIIVYPRVVPLARVELPTHAALGALPQPAAHNEDPSRVRGKRDYAPGDSLRRVDWKSSAAQGRLQVKQLDPSISLAVTIFLNLNMGEYELHARYDAPELAIVTAASLAAWIVGRRQAVGLATNGRDPLLAQAPPPNIPQPTLPINQEPSPPRSQVRLRLAWRRQALPHSTQALPERRPLAGEGVSGQRLHPPTLSSRQGRAHLTRLLEVLARIQPGMTFPLVDLLHNEMPRLAWGGVLLILTPKLDDDVFAAIIQARRAGLQPVLIPCGPLSNLGDLRRRAALLKVPFYQVYSERDLDRWRQ